MLSLSTRIVRLAIAKSIAVGDQAPDRGEWPNAGHVLKLQAKAPDALTPYSRARDLDPHSEASEEYLLLSAQLGARAISYQETTSALHEQSAETISAGDECAFEPIRNRTNFSLDCGHCERDARMPPLASLGY